MNDSLIFQGRHTGVFGRGDEVRHVLLGGKIMKHKTKNLVFVASVVDNREGWVCPCQLKKKVMVIPQERLF